MEGLKPINVFIDSSIYISRNFNFKDQLLGQIAKLANENHIRLFITEIVVNELMNKINEKSREVKLALESLRKKGMILRHVSQYNAIFNSVLSNSINSVIEKNFDDFREISKISTVSVDSVSISKLLNSYFQGTAPFSDKKKSEFPDAINLMALDSWCNINSEQMYVISSDNDLANYCENNSNLHHIETVDLFLNLVTSTDEFRHNFVVNLVGKHFENIEEIISRDFPDRGFSVENEDGYVENIEVLGVELEDDVNVIELGKNKATLQFEVRVNFEAEVTYTDYENSIFDKEEGKYLFEKEVELEVETDVLIPVIVQIDFNISDENEYNVISCKINDDQDISFMFYGEDYN
ncbi:PIN domain-containing protein [Paenibacillus thalictri]|uniref:DUF4935 domain-containing protein n=1 Tax=Paenibacillus thalictri TaxID=2527873 RepID=A0A4Q9DHJ6_9BACL|nr:PIN domain-containing protein [Paenibacillus thalictri]TBL69778.1 hypothetical protein EYB31_34965 [Paenibacillus thalictri]